MDFYTEDLILRKEGEYWTVYLGDSVICCCSTEDAIETIEMLAKKLDSGMTPEEIFDSLGMKEDA